MRYGYYDANGNQTYVNDMNNGFSYENRLISESSYYGSSAVYAYDPGGKRVMDGPDTKYNYTFLWDHGPAIGKAVLRRQ